MDFKQKFNEKYGSNPKLFGDKPIEALRNAIQYVDGHSALDLGVGNGRNAIFLLSKSFNVTGVDISEEGVEIVKKRAGNNPNLELVVSDVAEYETEKKFDLVLAIGLLHFFDKDKIDIIADKMKKWTSINGVNVVVVRMVQNYAGSLLHIFSKGELKKYYENDEWKTIEYREIEMKEKKIASIIARKLR